MTCIENLESELGNQKNLSSLERKQKTLDLKNEKKRCPSVEEALTGGKFIKLMRSFEIKNLSSQYIPKFDKCTYYEWF